MERVNHPALLCDLTTPDVNELGLQVVRAIIPGFHPLVVGHQIRSLGGKRLWTVPQKLGYTKNAPKAVITEFLILTLSVRAKLMSYQNIGMDLPVPEGEEDLAWEMFHENSKLTRFDIPPPDHEVLARMSELAESLSFSGYPVLELPESRLPLSMTLGDAVIGRSTLKRMGPVPVDLETLATLLHCGYGITRDERELGYPRAFRASPSAGALYPLEIFVHCAHASGFENGLYHFHPVENHLRLLRVGDQSESLATGLVNQNNVHDASLIFFITAVFERSTFKYRDRGYRFALIEAGHSAQNVNLAAFSLGLGTINVGGFYDRKIDDFL